MRTSDLQPAPWSPPEPGPALARGTALGRFVLLGLVGRGAMGEVYAAYDPELDRKIAIKLLRPRVETAGEGGDSRTRLMREAQATAKVSHPNVVIVYDAGTFGDRMFIAMEFIDGHTLRYWLQAQERTWHEILDAFLAAGHGLAAAHDKGLVHRDFKPDNVMVDAQGGQVRVMDFGLARVVEVQPAEPAAPAVDFEATLEVSGGKTAAFMTASPGAASPVFLDKITATGAVLGTPAYMSPEQFRSEPVDARSDQFSFCVALHEALYGDRPFAGRTLQELTDNVVRGRLAEPPASHRVPAWLREVLERGLRSDPAGRYPSMNELLAELERRASTGRKGFATGAAAKLAGVWEAPVGGYPTHTPGKERMRQAFLATGKPYAAAVFAGAGAVLDRYAQRWTELYVEVCEATHLRGEQSAEILDLRMACLEEGLDDLKALCRLFLAPTGEVMENAVNAANALGTLERCQDVKLLRAVVRLPDDPAKRTAVEALRARLVDVRALARVGGGLAARAALAPLVERARELAHAPTLAEILLLAGRLQYETSKAASSTFEEALWTAEAARHDEVAAEAGVWLVFTAGYIDARFDMAEIWIKHTEMILRRMGGHELLWAWYYTHRGVVRQEQGRLTEAVEDARQAIAIKERVLGTRSADVAWSLLNLGNHLAYTLDFRGALEVSARALEVATEALGRGHPHWAWVVSTHAQFLFRLGRFGEARAIAEAALAVLERNTDRSGTLGTAAMRTLGGCHLATGRFDEAVSVLERALAVREANHLPPLRLAEVRYPLARALFERGGAPARALALARQALTEYAQVANIPIAARDRAELEQWLAAHTPPPARAKRRPKKAKAEALARPAKKPKAAKRATPGPRRASRVRRRPSS